VFGSGARGTWFERTPPRTIALAGAALLVLSCVCLASTGATESDGGSFFALCCLAPIGAITLVSLIMHFLTGLRWRP